VKSNPKYGSFKYSRPMTRGIDVTVAAVIERDGKFLMVEERAGTSDKLVLNQPAGHLEQGESLVAAVAREALEETGHRFEPEHVVGFYLWRSPDADTTYLRVAFCGSVAPSADVAAASLDDGIVAVHWLSRIQLVRRAEQLRSPMVLRCIDDYVAGCRYPLESLTYLEPRPEGFDATDVLLRAFT
jgi:8-oxo-dGTP pyrophosphatase MutT (NUDIX family)